MNLDDNRRNIPEPQEGAFFGYEYLALSTLSRRPSLRSEFIASFGLPNKELPWYVGFVSSRQSPVFRRLIKEGYLKNEESPSSFTLCKRESLLKSYLRLGQNFTEFYLDNIFVNQHNPSLPSELFKGAPNLRVLSLKFNNLRRLSPEIGRLAHLERLYLTNNSLGNFTIPVSLVLCQRLKGLYLDNNYLDALPGFLLKMPSLSTVHRHGNNDYFKSTFLWYHMALHGRITMDMRDALEGGNETPVPSSPEPESSSSSQYKTPASLLSLSVKSVLSFQLPYFESSLPETLEDLISESYERYNICDNCGSALPKSTLGYQVFTFKNPYLGNTCVPFLHWSCSYDCGLSIEGPARQEQQTAALEQDKRYEDYIREEEANTVLRSSASCSALLSHKGLRTSLSSLNSHHDRRGSSPSASAACSIL